MRNKLPYSEKHITSLPFQVLSMCFVKYEVVLLKMPSKGATKDECNPKAEGEPTPG